MNLNIFSTLNQVKDLQAEKASLLERLETTQKDLTEAQDVIGDFMEEQKNFDTQIEAVKKEYEAKITALEVQLAEVKNSTNKEAANLLASIGVEPEAIKVAATVETNVLATFEKLTGNEKNEFYQKNREAILKATGLIK